MQPRRKEKYLFELELVAAVLNENGLPQPNASRFPPHGYWYLVADHFQALNTHHRGTLMQCIDFGMTTKKPF